MLFAITEHSHACASSRTLRCRWDQHHLSVTTVGACSSASHRTTSAAKEVLRPDDTATEYMTVKAPSRRSWRVPQRAHGTAAYLVSSLLTETLQYQ